VAFALCVLLQIVLWFWLLAGVSLLFHSDNSFVQAFCLGVAFLGIFLIGVANYFTDERIIREEYICSQAETGLAERRTNTDPTKRHKVLRRFALWIPTVTVVLACVFFEGIWAFGSPLVYPRRGSLSGHGVSIPITGPSVTPSWTPMESVLTPSS
jgi:hypothetical protein